MPRFHITKAAASQPPRRQTQPLEASGCVTPIDIQRIHRIFDPRPDCGELLRQSIIEREEAFNADLRIIGWGLAAAYLFVVVFQIARVAL